MARYTLCTDDDVSDEFEGRRSGHPPCVILPGQEGNRERNNSGVVIVSDAEDSE